MVKRSAKNELIARIEADIASLYAVQNYVGVDGSEKLADRIDADMARLQGIQNYVTLTVSATVTDAPKPKRTRKGKKGLPSAAAEGEAGL